MRIMVEIGHPAHVHHFKNLIWIFQKRGHIVHICTTDKDVTLLLLDSYGFQYDVLGKNHGKKLRNKIILFVKSEYNLFSSVLKFNPDIFISRVSPFSAHMSFIFRKPHISFGDTEHSRFTDSLAFPFTDVVCTPSCFRNVLGTKQITYNGYTELAYLHPNYFCPNPEVLKELGLNESDTFIILRFVSWEATHDIGHRGLTLEDKRKAVHEFEKYGKVFISSEKPLPEDLIKYKVSISPEKMHDLLYYAALLYGESATMASECAVLGTHAILCDYAGRGYTDEEETKYDLVSNFYNERSMGTESLRKALNLLKNPNLKVEGKIKRERLLNDKIDVTKFMIDFIENFFDSMS